VHPAKPIGRNERSQFPARVEYFHDCKAFTAVFGYFLCACAETALLLLSRRNLWSPRFSAIPISYKCIEMLLISQRFVFGHILVRMRRNSNFGASDHTVLTTLLNSTIPISGKNQKCRRSKSINYIDVFWLFVVHAQKRRYFCFRSEICCHRRSQVRRFPIRYLDFGNLTRF